MLSYRLLASSYFFNGCILSGHSRKNQKNKLEYRDKKLTEYLQVFQAIGQAAVMLTSSGFFAISYPFLGILLYIVQKFYLRTSRQLRLLDLEAKSPL